MILSVLELQSPFVTILADVAGSVVILCHMLLHFDLIEEEKNFATLVTRCSDQSASVLA